jgi:molybdopterin biosynthesis enzyme
MQLMEVPIAEAVGHVLCHNLADAQGRKAFHKGHSVELDDVARLAALGFTTVRVAVFAADDIHEDLAAMRLAQAIMGTHLTCQASKGGRVNVRASASGPLRVNIEALRAINEIDGLTVATLPDQRLVHRDEMVATIKVIPFAVPDTALRRAEHIGAAHSVLQVSPLQLRRVGVILVSSPAARRRVAAGLYPAIEARVQALHADVFDVLYVNIESEAIAIALRAQQDAQAELIIIAGETSIIDIDDVTPQGIRAAGGRVEHYGAPVEPGNLLLLAYLEHETRALPILGAPGCVRSRDINIVDLLLPRLMAGDMVRRADIVALGHGGLL